MLQPEPEARTPDAPSSASGVEPQAAAAWPRSIPIPRIENPSLRTVDALIYAGSPAIFQNAVPQELCEQAAPERLLEDAGDEVHEDFYYFKCREGAENEPPTKMTLNEFGQWMRSPDLEFAYAYNIPIETFSFAEKLQPHFERVHPELGADNMWIGNDGAHAGLHIHRQAWVGQLFGRKEVLLVDRKYTSHLPVSKVLPTVCSFNARCPDLEKFPELQKVVPYVGVLEPGDILFIPGFMWHALWPIGDSVSAHTFGRTVKAKGQEPFDWPDFTYKIPKWFGVGQVGRIIGQAMWYGLLKRPYHRPRGGVVPYGLLLWQHLTEPDDGGVKRL